MTTMPSPNDYAPQYTTMDGPPARSALAVDALQGLKNTAAVLNIKLPPRHAIKGDVEWVNYCVTKAYYATGAFADSTVDDLEDATRESNNKWLWAIIFYDELPEAVLFQKMCLRFKTFEDIWNSERMSPRWMLHTWLLRSFRKDHLDVDLDLFGETMEVELKSRGWVAEKRMFWPVQNALDYLRDFDGDAYSEDAVVVKQIIRHHLPIEGR